MLLSIHPRYVAKILDGSKTVELRRGRPAIVPGQPVAIYSTMPAASVVAFCRVSCIEISSPSELWNDVKKTAGVGRKEFEDYFRGSRTATALHLETIRPLAIPVSLADLRTSGPFHPPQTWHYLDWERVSNLFGDHPANGALNEMLWPASELPRTTQNDAAALDLFKRQITA
ncbi:ASCH domain-containing protein [Pengzhenrongella frigida]|uniref:ASCH domain-containing protein n=1 Tax=Pengzhenrongella frigida TaxID=1259133 RepID=A0A4Q5N122_9MICO|nr:ASCH domain-containing protein [Cellulomonas sp. HLT2-17]RYV51852.1 ASCH domain-containing protein [Cellulomonas sp. HLT2-17]